MARASLSSPAPYYSSSYNSRTDSSPYASYRNTQKPPIHTSSRRQYQSPSTYAGRYSPSTSSISHMSTYRTSQRPLPAGPGPLDASGNRMHLSSTNTNGQKGWNKPRPLRVDHNISHLSKAYSHDSHRDINTNITSTRATSLSRRKRNSSVSDLNTQFEDLSLNKPLSKGCKYGSNSDINSSVTSTPDRDRHKSMDRTVRTPISDRSSRACSEVSQRFSRASITDRDSSPALPDIQDKKYSNNIISRNVSRSPSPERVKENVYDATIPRRKLGYVPPPRSSSDSMDYNSNKVISASTSDNRGRVGLKNLGNTCFMNSVLQCLSNTGPLLDYCLKNEYETESNVTSSRMKGSLVKAFAYLLNMMWSKSPDQYVSPTEFKSQISKFASRFIGYSQQDAQEFLVYLLEGLHEDVNRVKEKKKRFIDDSNEAETIQASEKARQMWGYYTQCDNSILVDLFVGQLCSSLTCTDCGYVSNTFDPFWQLSLPIKRTGTPRLTDCFDLFTQAETLEKDERPTCAKCKRKQKCTKKFMIQRFPKILVIHLKRFSQGAYVRFSSKLSTRVDFPLVNLDLSKYSASNSCGPKIYNLYAVSNHSGNTSGGHYTAYAKHPKTTQWNHFNDARVSKAYKSDIVTSEAYVLFYELADCARL